MAKLTLFRVLDKVYGAMLWFYPAAHRRAYGAPMAQLFHDLCRDAVRERGNWGIVPLFLRIVQDAIKTAVTEHWDLFKERTLMAMTKRQHLLAATLAALPIALGLVLLAMNPVYMRRVVTRPVGWGMIAAVLVLSVVAYLAQRARRLPLRSSGTASSPGRAVSRTFLAIGALLCLLLAAWLVLLGPAFVLLLEGGLLDFLRQ